MTRLSKLLYAPRLERIGLLGLLALLAFACGVMMREAAWSDGPGIDALPKPGDSAAGTAMMLFYTIQAATAATALFLKRLRLFVLFLVALAAAPTVLLYVHLVTTIGFGAPAVQVDEFARVILAGVAAIALLVPWVFRRLNWPARTPGHLALGIAVSAGAVLQLVFHLIIVIPGSEISFDAFDRTRAVVERTSTPLELERLAEIGALPIVSITRETAADALEQAEAVDIPDVVASIDRIRKDAPGALHVWGIPGQSKVDRMALVYDGRAGVERLWLLPSSAFLEPRLTAISAYYYLTGLSGFVWMAGALCVHAGHSRRERRSPRRLALREA